MKTIVVKPAKRLTGEIRVQGDKSISHRAVILGSISHGSTNVSNYLPSDDCIRTINAFRSMGINIEVTGNGSRLRIDGRGPAGLSEPSDVLDMGNSGTSARLLCGLLSGQSFLSVMTGDGSLRSRPMKRVVEPLKMMGAEIWGRSGGEYLPLCIKGGRLNGISYSMPVASAQVKSAVLLAGLFSEGMTTVEEVMLTRDHTELMLEYFGADIKKEGRRITIHGNQDLCSRDIEVPGDISSAAFFMVAASILNDSEVIIKDVGINPTRTGIIDVLDKMGASIEVSNQRRLGGEQVGDITVRYAPLRGIEISGDMIPRVVDELPVLCIAAAQAHGETLIRDASELRVKESDRIAVMAECLASSGIEVEVFDDGMRIMGAGRPFKGVSCNSHGDHRIAMSMAIAGLAADGDMVIEDTECIRTSFPLFEETLKKLTTIDG